MELKTQNMDISGLVSRMSRFIKEALKCQSANTVSIESYDIDRLKSYVNAINTYRGWIIGQPKADCPETHPMEYVCNIPEMSEIDGIENESIKDWARLMYIAAQEIINSQSSRIASGLIAHDLTRNISFMCRIENFMTDYIETTIPLDLPETIPSKASVTQGNKGI